MPSSKQRHRIEIPEDLYQQLHALASRDGYMTTRFITKLLENDVREFVEERHNGQHRFASKSLGQRALAYLTGAH